MQSRFELSSTIALTMDADVRSYATTDGRVASLIGNEPRMSIEIRSIPKPVFDRVVQFLRPIFPELAQVETVALAESPQGRTLDTATEIKRREELVRRARAEEIARLEMLGQMARDDIEPKATVRKELEKAAKSDDTSALQNRVREMLRQAVKVCGKQAVIDAMMNYIPAGQPPSIKYISIADYPRLAEEIMELLAYAGEDGPTSVGITRKDVEAYLGKRGPDNFDVPGEVPSAAARKKLVVNAAPMVRELDLDDDED